MRKGLIIKNTFQKWNTFFSHFLFSQSVTLFYEIFFSLEKMHQFYIWLIDYNFKIFFLNSQFLDKFFGGIIQYKLYCIIYTFPLDLSKILDFI